MDFRKSLLISFALHMLLVLFLPGIRQTDEGPVWVEVSMLTFPDERERIPDGSPGEYETPVPNASVPDPGPPDLPAPADETPVGVPLEELPDRLPEFQEERDISLSREHLAARRAIPPRREHRGLMEEDGSEAEELISGPVSRRTILRKIKPDYPEWAEESGVEGEVQLKFWVTPEGLVSDIELIKTSGHPDFDSRAMEAVNKYIFSPLSGDEPREEQWGTITVKYRL